MKKENRTKRVMIYLTGFALLTFGQRSFVQAGFGAGSFDAFCVGLAGRSRISAGNWVTLCSCVMMIVSAILEKRKPDIKVLVSSFVFGFFFDFWGKIFALCIPNLGNAGNVLLFMIGMILAPFGTALYFFAGFSKSAFDEWIMATVYRFHLTVRTGKTLCEVLMIVLALLTGGPIGVTTIIVAVLFGPLLQHYIHYFEHHRIKALIWWE